MSDDNSLLHQAKQMIDERRYDEARQILESMPHNETARSWLEKLNQRAPQNSAKRSTPDIQFEGTIPMPPQVTAALKPIFSRLGWAGTFALFPAIFFGVTMGIEYAMLDGNNNIFRELNIVYLIVATLLTAINFYTVSYLLSLAFPKFGRNQLLGLVVIPTALTAIGILLGEVLAIIFVNPLEDAFLSWLLKLAFAGGIAFLFSSYNNRLASPGAPVLNSNTLILLFVGLFAVSGLGANLLSKQLIDGGGFITGLVNGLIFGACLGSVVYHTIKLSE